MRYLEFYILIKFSKFGQRLQRNITMHLPIEVFILRFGQIATLYFHFPDNVKEITYITGATED